MYRVIQLFTVGLRGGTYKQAEQILNTMTEQMRELMEAEKVEEDGEDAADGTLGTEKDDKTFLLDEKTAFPLRNLLNGEKVFA